MLLQFWEHWSALMIHSLISIRVLHWHFCMGTLPQYTVNSILTITSEAIRIQLVAGIAAASVAANIVAAILFTIMRHSCTLDDVITSEPIHVETVTSIAAASVGADGV